MNKALIPFLAVLFFIGSSSIILTSCGDHSHEAKSHESGVNDRDMHNNEGGEEHVAQIYQCPMQCEGDKTYDKPGKCPECKMDLEEIQKAEAHEHHDHEGHDHAH